MNIEPRWSGPPDISRMETDHLHIWRGFTPESADPRITNSLSIEEKQRAARFVRPKDRQRYSFSHGMLRIVLAHYLSVDPQYIVFKNNSYGKPRLWQAVNEPDICFNMAHSENIVTVAVTCSTPVGIDVEYIRELQDARQIVTRNFSPEEQKYIIGEQDLEFHDRFFTCWTLKEAFIKAIGMGLSHPLETFSVVDPNSENPIRDRVSLQGGTDIRWYQIPFHPLHNYRAAVVIKDIQPSPKFYDFNVYFDNVLGKV